MKITDIAFHKAKASKELNAVVFIMRPNERNGQPFIRLCIDERSKYTEQRTSVFVEVDVDMVIDNYHPKKIEINNMCFHRHVFRTTPDHIKTMLKRIKPTSEVRLRLVAFNGCDWYEKKGLEAHDLYMEIDDDCYLIQEQVSPIDSQFSKPVNALLP